MEWEDDFLGRERELIVLDSAWRRTESAFIPIYGRRRVGKSELIVHFLKRKRGIYHVGKQIEAEYQLRDFLETAALAMDQPLLASYPARGWADALKAVEDAWKGPEKLVLAMDEFQWTAEASPELPSVLQELWDRRWRKKNVMLILCGSYVGFMEREVLGRNSPLFGRRTNQIQLRPFGYAEAALFHPGLARSDLARIYFICGGVPYYLRCFRRDRSVEQNLAAAIFSDTGPLFREPEFLLREELRDVAKYHSILLTLARGSSTNAAIAKATAIDNRALHFYLSTLVELGYIKKRYPLTGGRMGARQVRYVLEDPLLRFWFRFVFPNLSRIPLLGPERTVSELVRPNLDSFCGYAFERLCREAMPALYEKEGLTAPFQIGEYWDKETQIDVVGLREDNWTDLGECKWAVARSTATLRDELRQRIGRFPNSRGASISLRYFTRTPSPVDQALPGERWHSLEDIYASGSILRESEAVYDWG